MDSDLNIVEKPDTSTFDLWLNIVRIGIGILAAAPVLFLCFLFFGPIDLNAVTDEFIALTQLIVFLAVTLACFVMPALITAGLLLRREALKRRPQKKYPVIIYILGGIVWLVYAGLVLILGAAFLS